MPRKAEVLKESQLEFAALKLNRPIDEVRQKFLDGGGVIIPEESRFSGTTATFGKVDTKTREDISFSTDISKKDKVGSDFVIETPEGLALFSDATGEAKIIDPSTTSFSEFLNDVFIDMTGLVPEIAAGTGGAFLGAMLGGPIGAGVGAFGGTFLGDALRQVEATSRGVEPEIPLGERIKSGTIKSSIDAAADVAGSKVLGPAVKKVARGASSQVPDAIKTLLDFSKKNLAGEVDVGLKRPVSGEIPFTGAQATENALLDITETAAESSAVAGGKVNRFKDAMQKHVLDKAKEFIDNISKSRKIGPPDGISADDLERIRRTILRPIRASTKGGHSPSPTDNLRAMFSSIRTMGGPIQMRRQARDNVRHAILEELIAKSSGIGNSADIVSGSKVLQMAFGKGDAGLAGGGLGEDFFTVLFNENRKKVKEFKRFFEVLQVQQSSPGTSDFGVAVKLLQPSALRETATGAATLQPGLLIRGSTLFLSPFLMASLALKDTGRKWLIEGLQTGAGTRAAEGLIGRLVSLSLRENTEIEETVDPTSDRFLQDILLQMRSGPPSSQDVLSGITPANNVLQ